MRRNAFFHAPFYDGQLISNLAQCSSHAWSSSLHSSLSSKLSPPFLLHSVQHSRTSSRSRRFRLRECPRKLRATFSFNWMLGFFTVWLDAYVSERQYAARNKITSKAKQTKRFLDILFRVRVPFEISDLRYVLQQWTQSLDPSSLIPSNQSTIWPQCTSFGAAETALVFPWLQWKRNANGHARPSEAQELSSPIWLLESCGHSEIRDSW